MVEISNDLDFTTAKQLELSDEERVKIINSEQWIGYTRAQQGVAKLVELMDFPRKSRMPNILILSPTNNGKTMIIKRFFRFYYPTVRKREVNGYCEYEKVPVLYLQMPSAPDLKRFYALILYSVGLGVPSVARIAELESVTLKVISDLKVQMLVIDELHNILAGRSDNQREFLNLLRFLGNELRIPIIALGTKDAYLAIRSDDQLENRFEPFILPAWKYDHEYLSLLSSFGKIFLLKHPVNLTKPNLAKKILEMSDGKIGEISTIVKKAIIWALRYRCERLTDDVFDRIDYKSPSERRKQIERELN